MPVVTIVCSEMGTRASFAKSWQFSCLQMYTDKGRVGSIPCWKVSMFLSMSD